MKLFFLVTEDWYFYSHRLPMARAAQKAGFDVTVLTHVRNHKEAIEREGIEVIPFSLDRRSLNPFSAIGQWKRLADIYRREKPDVVHHIAMKPVMIGSMAAMAAGVPSVINAFAGLGYLFTEQTKLARYLRMAMVPMFRFALRRKNSLLLLQNDDDRRLLGTLRMTPEKTMVIRGSGVDLNAYKRLPLPPADEEFICAFAGRMIDIKGLPTLRAAFAMLEQTHPHIKLWLCGQPDAANPGSWTKEALTGWAADTSNVIYKGQSDMASIWAQAHLALQPSWGGEGIPKSLLEAAACGRAAVASDVPGCREVVKDGVNGYLVRPRDAGALAQAIVSIASNSELWRSMADKSRTVVEGELSADGVAQQAFALYKSCVSHL